MATELWITPLEGLRSVSRDASLNEVFEAARRRLLPNAVAASCLTRLGWRRAY